MFQRILHETPQISETRRVGCKSTDQIVHAPKQTTSSLKHGGGAVTAPLELTDWDLLMISLLMEAAGWMQRSEGASCAQVQPN